MSRKPLLLTVKHYAFLLTIVLVFVAHNITFATPTPYRPLRYTNVTGQADWYTCGAAAVSTLLTYYYDDPATEQEVLEVAFAETQASGKDPLEGLTALSLKRALQSRGYTVKAYRVDLEQLADYFRRGGLPVVAHVTKPQLHFLVVSGIVPDPRTQKPQVLLADPSWGRRIVPLQELVTFKGFSGVILLAVPKTQEQLANVRKLQEQELAWARAELARLTRLRDRLP